MKTVKTISGILFYISRLVSALYFCSFALSSAALASGWSMSLVQEETYFEIHYPFTHVPFLLGEYNRGYIVMFLLLLGMYGVFFFLIGNVFLVFTQRKLFTLYGIRQLKIFYLGNLVLPALSIMVIGFFYPLDSTAAILVALHMLLGVFSYFLAAIFKEGFNLQTDNDLIL